MRTQDLFKHNRSAKKLSESLQKTFGKKLNLESFETTQLEDARNKLRTQVSQARSQSGFNENLENDALHQAQWMLDAINAEIAEREEFIVDSVATEDESVETGDDMTKLREGEIQQASAIVTAKTMVDRVGRWIEELSGMENETLLQLGDSIRDEMGQEQAKAFIEAVAPAIQQALENLKNTRDTLSTGVRALASGEAPDAMLGADPAAGADMGGDDELGDLTAEPDAMNAEPMAGAEDDFSAADAAAGPDEAGREQRESIDRGNSLLRVLAG